MKLPIFCSLAICAATTFAQSSVLEGFAYGDVAAPAGNEWESPQQLSLNKEQPRAYMFSFATQNEAQKVLRDFSPYHQSLDGTWQFHWVETPSKRPADFYKTDFNASQWDNIQVPGCWNMQGLGKNGEMKYGVPIYCNQPVIFYHKVEVDDWRGGVMRKAPDNWTVAKYPNEVGSYRRTFTIPENWKGREVYINFDGVSSFFYLWINGKYVGFSKNSRNTASFNISKYLVKGENLVAVEVYRNSDGSFLEAQDFFRLPGIFRSTYLTSTPKVQIRDLSVTTESINPITGDATLAVKYELRNLNTKNAKNLNVAFSLFPVKMYSDEITNDPIENGNTTRAKINVNAGKTRLEQFSWNVGGVKAWSAEAPNRYALVATVSDSKGRVIETTSTYIGVRKVEIRNTAANADEFGLAGRYFYINDKPVKLKGVNRHETNLTTGHAITHKQMQDEVMLMKRANINHVRNSHYSNDPYWYYLCDKFGIYLEDEANLESHQYYYGKASLSHPIEWRPAHVARNMELVHQHVNHPSIVIWSLGNEAGPGDNFVAAYEAIKAYDTSRPVQYERNNNIVDMGSNQYPSIKWVREAVKGNVNIIYPFHISEYAHSMGNAVGNLQDYWDAIESTNFFCGGAIWDWVDQAMDTYTTDGVKFMGYGGDHGDFPNSGMFCMNGIIFPDFSPKPQYWEVKKVYQNVGVKMLDAKTGKIEVFNKRYFTPLADVQMKWQLLENGVKISEGDVIQKVRKYIGPREKAQLEIPYNFESLKPGCEYFVTVQFILAKDEPWAKAGYVQMEEQLLVKEASASIPVANTAQVNVDGSTISGDGFSLTFNDATGEISHLASNGVAAFEDNCGPTLNAFRATTDNDNWFDAQWYQNGLHNLTHKVLDKNTYTRGDGAIVVSYVIESRGKTATLSGGASGRYKIDQTDKDASFAFTTNQIYTIFGNGEIVVEAFINSNNPAVILPRLGYMLKTPTSMNAIEYYGRGPENNYNDRCTGQFLGVYKSTAKDMFIRFPKPQELGNRENVRWAKIGNDKAGFFVRSLTPDRDGMSISFLPWNDMQLTLAPHPHELPQSDGNYLHIDFGVTGLGGNSCGQGGPLVADRINAGPHHFSFVMGPQSQFGANAVAGDMPLGISRDNVGKVSLISLIPGATIKYVLNNGKKSEPLTYTWPIDMREGGTITAWYENQPQLKTTQTYEKIFNIPVTVVGTSSEETGHDDDCPAANLVDGDPSTIWHTMYSVTVSIYPHSVDFDCSEPRQIKGFTFLPRQTGRTGMIKDYEIYVSADGKNWGSPIHKGAFDNTAALKTVEFNTKQNARFLRFNALSSHDGYDYASGAEFSILAE